MFVCINLTIFLMSNFVSREWMMSELIYTRSTVTQSLMRRRFTELERISFKLSLDLSEFSYYNY